MYPDDRVAVSRALQSSLFERKPYSQDHRMVTRDGHVLWVHCEGVIQSDEKTGLPLRLIGASTNITHRKEAENALRESENRFKLVVETVPVGLWMLDQKGQVIYGNRTGINIWGGARYVRPDQFGQYEGWWYDTGKRIGAEEWAGVRAVFKGETSIGETIRIKGFDGQKKVITLSAVPIRDEVGLITGAVVINQDITSQKRAEEYQNFFAEIGTIFTESMDYRSTLQSVSQSVVPRFADSCIIFLRRDDQTVLLELLNCRDDLKEKGFESRANFSSDGPAMTYPLEALPVVKKVLITGERVMVLDTATLPAEYKYPSETQWIHEVLAAESLLATPMVVQGRNIGVLFFSMSGSGRKFENEDLWFFDELSRRAAIAIDNANLFRETKAAVLLREEVLAVVSHDIRNPVTTIRLSSEILEKTITLDEDQRTKFQKFIKNIQTSCRQIETLVSDLLVFARSASGTWHLQKKALFHRGFDGRIEGNHGYAR